MKNLVILEIMNSMSEALNNKQLEILKSTLSHALYNKEIVECSEQNKILETDESLIKSFLSAKNVEGCSKRTISYYKSTIENLMMYMKSYSKSLRELETNDIRKYITDYTNNHSANKTTLDNIRRIISSLFSWLEEENYIIKSPARRVHKIKTGKTIKTVYSDEELEILRDNSKNIRNLAIIDILASTGMRIGELVNLKISDIDFDKRECKVLGKGNKERIVYFDARTKIHLKEYLSTRLDNEKSLFVSLNSPNNPLKISGIEIMLRALGKQLNINRVHPHKFRRTLATKAIDKGMPIEQVQVLLGHSKIDTTMHYVMVNQNNVKQSHRKYIG